MKRNFLILAAALELAPGNFEVVVRPGAKAQDRVVQYAAEELTNFRIWTELYSEERIRRSRSCGVSVR